MKLSYIAQSIGVSCPQEAEINAIDTLGDADETNLSFLDNEKYAHQLHDTRAKAVLVSQKHEADVPPHVIKLVTEEPYLKLALATKLFAKPPFEIGEPKLIAANAQIMNGAYIGKGAVIGENAIVMCGAYIGDNVHIGANSIIFQNVSIYRECTIGANCIIHAGAVIGSDGFGFAHTKLGEHVKIYQNGSVIIEDDVEIGANTTIDRAVFGNTIVKHGTKIDNLVQIGHNCEIGEYSIIVSQTGIAGSSHLGRNVVMGGQSATAGHVSIGDFATLAARSGVSKNIPGGKTYGGFPLMEQKQWLKLQAKLQKMLD